MATSKPRKSTATKAEDSTPDKSEAGLQAQREADQEQVRTTGFLGDTGETPEGTEPVKPASESAPEGASTKREDGVVDNGSDTLDLGKVPTVTEAAKDQPKLEGKAYQQGYLGELPDADNRPDLTLKGVLGDQG